MREKPADHHRKNDDFYRRLFEHAAVAMIATDKNFEIIFCNPAAVELLGIGDEVMIDKPIEQFVPEKKRRALKRLMDRTVRRGVTTRFETDLSTPSGEKRSVMVFLSPIPNPEDSSCSLAVWIIDQTARTRLSQRLARAEKTASLGRLASGVAHHFNNIFGGVATFVDFALTSGDPASMKQALQITEQAAERASKITKSLLSYTEQDTRRGDLADLTEVVLTFANLIEQQLAERGIELKLDLKPAPVVAVKASRMHQALGNLLINSEEAMPDGGILRIAIDRSDKKVILTFSDTGCGMASEDLQEIFEPFFTTKGLHAGGQQVNPGLGLSVVHGIILEMGGRIDVKSAPSKGTTFTISFPIPISRKS